MHLKEVGIRMKDFTVEKYEGIIRSIYDSNYNTITFRDYFTNEIPEKFIIIRHDVDKWPKNAQVLADIENSYGIHATYYFRTVKKVFKPQIIQSVETLGHEIGYHYETMAQAKGNLSNAYNLFSRNLNQLRAIANIDTICMHGSSFSKYDNRWLWENYNYKDLRILGEPYLDINYSKVSYFSDSGGSWKDSGQRTRDQITNVANGSIKNSDDLISLIKSEYYPKMIILMHPDRWNNNCFAWYYEYVTKNLRNLIKKAYNQIK